MVASKETQALACGSRFTARVVEQPDVPPRELALWIDELLSSLEYELVVPTTEAALLALRTVAEDHPVRVSSIIPSNDALDTALDKSVAQSVAEAVGMSVAATRVLVDAQASQPPWGYPSVLKPVRSKFVHHGRLVTGQAAVARSPAERREYLREWVGSIPVLEQEFVPGDGVGVSFLSDNGRVLWHFAHHRLHEFPLAGGPSTYRRSIAPPEGSLEACRRLAQRLCWHGVAMVEFKWDRERDTLTFLEVNPRLWGSLALAIRCGVDFPVGLLKLAQGKRHGPQPAYRLDVYCRNVPRDLLWFRAQIREAISERSLPRAKTTFAAVLPRPRLLARREYWDHFAADDPKTAMRVLDHGVRNLVQGAS